MRQIYKFCVSMSSVIVLVKRNLPFSRYFSSKFEIVGHYHELGSIAPTVDYPNFPLTSSACA